MSSSTTVASRRVPRRSASAVLPTPSGPFDREVAELPRSVEYSSYQGRRRAIHASSGLELRLLRLPLVRVLRDQLRPHLRPDVRARDASTATACRGSASASPTPIRTTAPRPPSPRGTSSRTSSRRSCSAARSRIRATSFRRSRACAATTWPRPRVEMAAWDLYARRAGVPLCAAARRHAPRDRIGRLDRHPGFARRSSLRTVAHELAAGYRRIKIKIKPGWDIDAVEMVRAQFGGIPLMVDANAAYTLADAAHLARARSLRPDDDRAAARLRRHPRSRARCSGG